MRPVLFDALSLQARMEGEQPGRLSAPGGFFEALRAGGFAPRIDPLDALEGVVVLPTRYAAPYPFELVQRLVAFVQAGGGLILMSNHGPFRWDAPDSNATRFDASVASAFGVAFDPVAARRADKELLSVEVSGVLAGDPSWPAAPMRSGSTVTHAVSNNCSGVFPSPVASPIGLLPEGLEVIATGDPPRAGLWWGCTIEGGPAGAGRVVVVADSGWCCRGRDENPRYGQIAEGDNVQLALNMVTWVSGARRSA
ncbi:MAG: hypothetical protein KC656_03435 [Myxococcales bacterium]|nr:hypothetical protein [Myxococcales bacterium]